MATMPPTPPLKHAKRLVKYAMKQLPVWRTQVRARAEFFGSDYGGWAVIPELIKPDSVIWSFGIGHDASFDLAMIERFGVTVHGFDPTPGLADWIAAQNFDSSFVFHDVGLADFDGSVEIRSQSTSEQTSGTILGRDELKIDTSGEQIQVKRLSTLMDELNTPKIDLLKMDIEGAEFGVIDDLLASSVRPTQLLVEFHRYFVSGAERERKAFAALSRAGYKLFDISPRDMEFGFVWQG
jgi:FkbM family methyltransferase